MDCGLRIIDDLRSETPGAAVRQTKPICHSEIPPLRPSASDRNDTREAPEPPAPNKANSDRPSQVAKREVVAPNKPNLACSVSEPAEGPSGENALRRHYERAKQSQSGPATPGRQTKPILRCMIVSVCNKITYTNRSSGKRGRMKAVYRDGHACHGERSPGGPDGPGRRGRGRLRVVDDRSSDVAATRTAPGAFRPSEAWACGR